MPQTYPDPDSEPVDLPVPEEASQRGWGLGLLIFALFAPLLLLAAMLLMNLWMGAPGFTRDYAVRFDLPPAGALAALPDIAGPNDPASPLVVIDAGHGGHDPGDILRIGLPEQAGLWRGAEDLVADADFI